MLYIEEEELYEMATWIHAKNESWVRFKITPTFSISIPPMLSNMFTTGKFIILLNCLYLHMVLIFRFSNQNELVRHANLRLKDNLTICFLHFYLKNSRMHSHTYVNQPTGRVASAVEERGHLTIGSYFCMHYWVMEHVGSLESTKEA